MSKVFSFRLDENNPREAQAREVIQTWLSTGYSLRHIMVEALTNYGVEKLQKDELSFILDKIIDMIQNLNSDHGVLENNQDKNKGLAEAFLSAIANANKPGLRVNDMQIFIECPKD